MTEAQNKLYEKAKQYAKENVKGNCDELKCLAEMLYEFTEQETKLLSKHILELQKTNGTLTDRVDELENKLENIRYYLDNEIPHKFINEATSIIYKMV